MDQGRRRVVSLLTLSDGMCGIKIIIRWRIKDKSFCIGIFGSLSILQWHLWNYLYVLQGNDIGEEERPRGEAVSIHLEALCCRLAVRVRVIRKNPETKRCALHHEYNYFLAKLSVIH